MFIQRNSLCLVMKFKWIKHVKSSLRSVFALLCKTCKMRTKRYPRSSRSSLLRYCFNQFFLMRWPIGSLIKGLSYGWTAGSLAGDLPFWHLQIAAMLHCPTDPYIPMRNRWTRSGTIENHGISWFRGNMWCTKLAIEKSSEGPALVFLFYKIVQCYDKVCSFFILIACSSIFREANSQMYDFPQLRRTISIGTCFNTPMRSVLRFVVLSISFHLISSVDHMFFPFFSQLRSWFRHPLYNKMQSPGKHGFHTVRCSLAKSYILCHTWRICRSQFDSVWLVGTVWKVCSVSGPTKSSKVSERIVVKPYALNEAWGSFFCHCQCVFFDERAAALRSILHDHDSWRCLTWVHRSTFLKPRNVWHRNWHRIAWLHDLEKLNVFFLHNMAGSMILSASLSGAIVLRDVYELPSWRIALYSLSVMVVILGILANTETTWTGNLET